MLELPPNAKELKINMERGETFDPVFTLYDSDNALIDLTGHTAEFDIRASENADGFIYQASTASEITLGGVAGTMTFDVPAADTVLFDWRLGYYVMRVIDAAGKPRRLFYGEVEVIPN